MSSKALRVQRPRHVRHDVCGSRSRRRCLEAPKVGKPHLGDAMCSCLTSVSFLHAAVCTREVLVNWRLSTTCELRVRVVTNVPVKQKKWMSSELVPREVLPWLVPTRTFLGMG
jgi:hypothetical protein